MFETLDGAKPYFVYGLGPWMSPNLCMPDGVGLPLETPSRMLIKFEHGEGGFYVNECTHAALCITTEAPTACAGALSSSRTRLQEQPRSCWRCWTSFGSPGSTLQQKQPPPKTSGRPQVAAGRICSLLGPAGMNSCAVPKAWRTNHISKAARPAFDKP